MSESLATASAASVDGYPVYTMKALGEFQAQIPGVTNIERAIVSLYDVIDFLKSPVGMSAYSTWAKKPLPENPIDAMNLLRKIENRFLVQGRQQPMEALAENQTASATGLTGDAAQPS